jgi:hypothetical protein
VSLVEHEVPISIWPQSGWVWTCFSSRSSWHWPPTSLQ